MKLLKRYQPTRYQPPFRLLDFMRQVSDSGLINLAAGVPSVSLLPIQNLDRAYHLAVRHSRGESYAYQLPEGNPVLREMLADRMRGRGVDLPSGPDQVLLTVGATEGLQLALRLLVRPGDTVVCESPCYYNLFEQIADRGAKALPVPTDLRNGIEPGILEPYLKKHRPRCLVVCSTLSNPSGATIPESARADLVELCRCFRVAIIEDEVYAELRDGGTLPPLRAYDDGSTVFHVASFCKSVAPGLRVGAFMPGRFWEEAAQMRCMEIMHASTLTEAILCEFLKAGFLDDHLKRSGRLCRRRRNIVRKAVAEYFPGGTVCSDPEGGFLLWAVLPEEMNPEELSLRCLKRGVSFARGEVFLTGKPRRACMRLNCARASEKELTEGIRVIGEEITFLT